MVNWNTVLHLFKFDSYKKCLQRKDECVFSLAFIEQMSWCQNASKSKMLERCWFLSSSHPMIVQSLSSHLSVSNWTGVFGKKNSSGNDWVIKAVGQGLLMEFEDYDVLDSKGFRKTTRQPLIRKRVQIGSCFPEVQEVWKRSVQLTNTTPKLQHEFMEFYWVNE